MTTKLRPALDAPAVTKRCFFDIETNGLLDNVTTFHCGVIGEADGTLFSFTDLQAFMAKLAEYNEIVGHNIIRYDIPVLEKLTGEEFDKSVNVVDTLVMARLARPDIKDEDFNKVRAGLLPPKLAGSHSLEAWGYRLGKMKGEYKHDFIQRCADEGIEYTPGMEWLEFSQDMMVYNEQDVVVTTELYHHLLAEHSLTPQSLSLEHRCAYIMAEQERFGFKFDIDAAESLYATLITKRYELEQKCAKLFAPWVVNKGTKVSKVNSKAHGYVKDVEFTVIEVLEFNPSSRAHIADRLKTVYGWEPKELTPSGTPKVDEAVLGELPYPACKLLTEYLLVAKRVGQLAEGNQSWLKHYNSKTGCIHGAVNTNGAVTGRATHSFPNVAQVPASRSPYGHECRALFTVQKGWRLAGTDAAGLELRCLAHYMARWDNGQYGDKVVNGDIHTENQKAAGLSTRDEAKTFIYAFLYGAGDEKIGSIVGKGRKQGAILKKNFTTRLPALGNLITAVQNASKRGYLVGLDGRKIAVRSEHAALNTLLQGAGAIVCKAWLCELYDLLIAEGYKVGTDFRYCAWVHDELQVAINTTAHPELEAAFPGLSQKAMENVAELFSFKCPLATSCAVGNNWAETH